MHAHIDLTPAHLKQVAEIHTASFPNSLLTALGGEAVTRYYLWLLEGPHDRHALGLVADDDTLVGFCFCGVFRGAMSGFLRRNRTLLAASLLRRPRLLVDDRLRESLPVGLRSLGIKALAGPAAGADPRGADPAPRAFGILAIAVHPNRQGSGAGRMLMDRAEQIARERGFSCMQLTVRRENEAAIGFYERLGWRRVAPGSEWTGLMQRQWR